MAPFVMEHASILWPASGCPDLRHASQSIFSVTFVSSGKRAVQPAKTFEKLLEAVEMEADNQDR